MNVVKAQFSSGHQRSNFSCSYVTLTRWRDSEHAPSWPSEPVAASRLKQGRRWFRLRRPLLLRRGPSPFPAHV